MKKLIPILFLFFIACQKEKKDYNIQINAVKQSFETKKIDSLKPYLANGFTMKGLPEGMESLILPEILKKAPAPEKFIIKSETKEERGTRVIVDFYYQNQEPEKANFLIAKDGKFLELNIFEDVKVSTKTEK